MSTVVHSLEVTYRKGRPVAAYFYLPRRDEDRAVRTERRENGLLVDFASDDRPIGIEITAPSALTLDRLNHVLRSVGQALATVDDLSPLHAE